MREIRAVIFDNDGLLNNIERLRNSLWPVAAERCGYPGLQSSEFQVTLGKTSSAVLEAVRTLVCPHLPKPQGLVEAGAIRDLRNRLVSEHLEHHGVEAKPGARDSLEYLRELQMPTALWTSSRGDDARRLLELTDLRHFFPDERIVSGDMVSEGKPHPEGALKAAHAIDTDPQHCAGVDDTQVGSDAFRSARMFSIRVPDLEPISVAGISSIDAAFPSLVTMTAWMKGLRCDRARAALLIEPAPTTLYAEPSA